MTGILILMMAAACMAVLQAAPPAPQEDATREMVKRLLASYGGLSILVVGVLSGMKSMWDKWVPGKEPALAVILTFVFGIAAKLLMPAVYGENTLGAWGLHGIILLLVAVGAKGIHDGVINAFKKEKGGTT